MCKEYFKTCPFCGAHLDPDEKCDCQDKNKEKEEEKEKHE